MYGLTAQLVYAGTERVVESACVPYYVRCLFLLPTCLESMCLTRGGLPHFTHCTHFHPLRRYAQVTLLSSLLWEAFIFLVARVLTVRTSALLRVCEAKLE